MLSIGTVLLYRFSLQCSNRKIMLWYTWKFKINLDDTELDNDQKKAFFKIPYTALVELLNECDLISDQIAKDMKKINDLRQKYVHPLLEGDSYKDSKHSINLLCSIIDSYVSLKRSMHHMWISTNEKTNAMRVGFWVIVPLSVRLADCLGSLCNIHSPTKRQLLRPLKSTERLLSTEWHCLHNTMIS